MNCTEDGSPCKEKISKENEIIFIVLATTVVLLLIFFSYLWLNRDFYGFFQKKMRNTDNIYRGRDTYYQSKAKIDQDDPNALKALRQLLMQRAMYTVPAIETIQTTGNSVQKLYNRGMLTDSVFDQIKVLKAFIDEEIPSVQQEAEDLMEGWSQKIWAEAFHYHRMIKERENAESQGGQGQPSPVAIAAVNEKKEESAEKRRELAKLKAAEEIKKRKEAMAEKAAKELIQEEESKKKK